MILKNVQRSLCVITEAIGEVGEGEERQRFTTRAHAAKGILECTFLGHCLTGVNFKNNVIRSYGESLMLYVKHCKYGRKHRLKLMSLLQKSHWTYEERVIFEGGRFRGALAVYGHPPLEGCRLVPSARGCGHVLHVEWAGKQQVPVKTRCESHLQSPDRRPGKHLILLKQTLTSGNWPSWFVRK